MLDMSNALPLIAFVQNIGTYVYSFFYIIGEIFTFPSSMPLSSFSTSFTSPINNNLVSFSFSGNEWIADLIDSIVEVFSSAPMVIVESTGIESTFGIELLASLISLVFAFFVLKIIVGFFK